MGLLDSTARLRLVSRLGALSIFGLAGCSLLYGFESTQCSQDADCEVRGPAFAGSICQKSFCVTATGGSDGLGGSDGGCTTNSECIDAEENFGEPAVCRHGTCFPLKVGTECPWVLGAGGEDLDNLRKADPIIIGAYAPIDLGAATKSAYVANYDLAIEEMNEATSGGLTGGPGGSLRPFVAVVCDSIDDPDFDLSLGHLIDDLEVPAIISAIFAKDLKSAFTEKGQPNEVFFLSPIDADSSLTSIIDDDLLWHMLGAAHNLSPGFIALVHDVETYVRQQRGIADSDPIKLALVDADTQFLNDITDDLLSGMTFNGQGWFENGDNFLRSQTDSALEVPQPDVSQTVDELIDFVPDVVVSVGSPESLDLIHQLEAAWTPQQEERPFYIVSPYVFGQPDLLASTLADVHQRMFGINFAAAEQAALYNNYFSNLQQAYPNTEDLDGKENFYDAAYFLMYAIAGAGPPPVTGREIAVGMKRLINPTSSTPRYEVGRSHVTDALTALSVTSSRIALIGTLGDPLFNITGARADLPSVYCVADRVRIQNALLYDPVNEEIYEPASGPQPCVPEFSP